MSRSVWRIATDAATYPADDLSGTGAGLSGGRWNAPGGAMIYAAESRALACLETIVHLNAGGLPFNRYLVEIRIPDDVWALAKVETDRSLPVGWDALPASRTSIALGDAWLAGLRSALLIVPSVIVAEERNVLINPKHPQLAAITAQKVRKWTYDPRVGA